jgi:superfamily II DNA or RNA helicase
MSQAQRNRTLADFKEGKINILVATNVAARGLHIDNLGLIINYDRAQSEEIHLHRIGRTGRMGQEGKAISFIPRKETLDERMSEDHPEAMGRERGPYSGHPGERRPYGSAAPRGERRPYGERSPHREGAPYGERRPQSERAHHPPGEGAQEGQGLRPGFGGHVRDDRPRPSHGYGQSHPRGPHPGEHRRRRPPPKE